MIIFILIFFAVIITVGAAAVFGFSFYLRRRTQSLQSKNHQQFLGDAPQYRGLFEPDDEEMRLLERHKTKGAEAEKIEATRETALEKAARVAELQTIFLENPNRKNTVDFLSSAAASESAKTFGAAAESVMKIRRENKIKNLSSTDLADLLDSHLGILPQQERASGAIFWLKQEIADLRRKSES